MQNFESETRRLSIYRQFSATGELSEPTQRSFGKESVIYHLEQEVFAAGKR